MKRGFTLIELLAVIVILAIIALITTVVVINIIETVKIRKYKVEEKSLEKAAELYYTNSQIFPFQDEISLNTLVEKGFINSVKDTGNGSTCEGKVIKDNNGELKGCLKCSNYVTEGCGYVIEQEIKDENPGVICGSGKTEDYDNQTECHIKSVEDLVTLSYLVNSGKTFEGKTVFLDKNLNITDYTKNKSYVDAEKLALYDINEDGKITSLKDEMTTEKGFEPIGTSSNPFKGRFEGNAYTISNLIINRPTENYVGLFGYLKGTSSSRATVAGLNVENIKVNGNNSVGGIAGYIRDYANIIEVTASGNITGNNNVGGIVGELYNSTSIIKSVISNVNVTGKQYVGGLVGYSFYDSNTSGIVEGGTITGNSYVSGTSYRYANGYVNEKVIIEATGLSRTNGTSYTDSEYGNINLYNDYLDTWIGGDNDSSGYYFDYESNDSNKIVLRSTERNPIETTLKGEGTKESPYLIYTREDMKKIAAMPTEQNYYKLMNDIDYKDEHYYVIGRSSNPFSGVFEGSAYKLKNISIYGYNNLGLFGYLKGTSSSRATVAGLNVENIKVNGNNSVGGIAGYIRDYANIIEVTASGNITGNNNVGGIVGELYNSTSIIKSVISNVNVTGKQYVGGLVGYSFYDSNTSGIVEGGTITGNSYVSGTSYRYANGYVNEKVIIEATGPSGTNGTRFSKSYYNNLQYYANLKLNSKVVIETPYSGDIDGSGYYFDYNNKGDDIVVVKVKENTSTTPTGNEVYKKVVTDGPDTELPTCILNRYSVYGSGFTASYTCTDNNTVKARKHIYWETTPENVNYENLIAWPSTSDSSSDIVNSVWTVESANLSGINPPIQGKCYYFYYGAQDEAGNTIIYSTPICLSY